MRPNWEPIPGFEGYECSSSGRVRTTDTKYEILRSGRAYVLSVNGQKVRLPIAEILRLRKEGKAAATPSPKPATPAPTVAREEAAASPPPQPTPEPEPTPVPAVDTRTISEREREWLRPEHVLPLRDPWASGTIESKTDWDWAGIV